MCMSNKFPSVAERNAQIKSCFGKILCLACSKFNALEHGITGCVVKRSQKFVPINLAQLKNFCLLMFVIKGSHNMNYR